MRPPGGGQAWARKPRVRGAPEGGLRRQGRRGALAGGPWWQRRREVGSGAGRMGPGGWVCQGQKFARCRASVILLEGFEEVETKSEFWVAMGKRTGRTRGRGERVHGPGPPGITAARVGGTPPRLPSCQQYPKPLLSRVLSPGDTHCVSLSPCGPCLLSCHAFPSSSPMRQL